MLAGDGNCHHERSDLFLASNDVYRGPLWRKAAQATMLTWNCLLLRKEVLLLDFFAVGFVVHIE